MKIAFIGAGKVANVFAMYLIDKGLSVDYIHSKTSKEALEMAKLTSSSYCETLKDLVEKSDLIFITTGDNQIAHVAKKIADGFRHEILKEKTFIHMSGALTSDELEVLRELGADCYSLHPLQSFAEKSKAHGELVTTVFSIEGDKKNDHINRILFIIGNEIINLSKEDKVKYHIAACIASNYLQTLLDSSLKLFDEIGIGRELAIKSLSPLIDGALGNFKSFSSEEALTGPIKRGDINTITKHVKELEFSDLEELYKTMARYTVDIAEKSDSDKLKLEEIRKLLK